MRTKDLSWSARIVSASEYHEAKEQALEVQREKKRFETQRFALKRQSVKQAAILSGVIDGGKASAAAEYDGEETDHIKDLEGQVQRLSSEVKFLVADLRESKTEAEFLNKQRVVAEDAKTAIDAEWRSAILKIAEKDREIEFYAEESAKMGDHIADLEANITALDDYVESSGRTFAVTEQCLRECNELCADATHTAELELITMTSQSNEREKVLQEIEDQQSKAASLTSQKAILASKDSAIQLLTMLANDLLDELATCRVAIENKNVTLQKVKDVLEFSLSDIGKFRASFEIASPMKQHNPNDSGFFENIN